MKTFALAILAAAAMITSASASNVLPPEFRGHWCLDKSIAEENHNPLLYHRRGGARCHESDDRFSIEVTARQINWRGRHCQVEYMGAFRHSDWLGIRCQDGKLEEYHILLDGGQLSLARRP